MANIFRKEKMKGDFEIWRGFLKKRGSGVVGTLGKERRKPLRASDDEWSVRSDSAQPDSVAGKCNFPARVSCYTREEVKASSVKPSADRGSDGCSHAFRRDNSTLLPLDFPNPCSLLLTPNLSLTAITKIGTFLICSSRRQSRHTWVNNRPLLLTHYRSIYPALKCFFLFSCILQV